MFNSFKISALARKTGAVVLVGVAVVALATIFKAEAE